MNKLIILFFILNSFIVVNAQNIIKLPYEKSTDIIWVGEEKEYYSEITKNHVVTNVSIPTMELFKPSKVISNGTSVIIAPGGGFYGLMIESQGREIAEWLNTIGITAFVLKYRLVPTGEDGIAEMAELIKNNNWAKLTEEVAKVKPLSINDGLNAIAYIRKNTDEFGVASDKIGFMGFSAGGSVAMGVAYNYKEGNKPNFLVSAYAWTTVMPVQTPKEDAPPLFIVCASDDYMGVAPGSIELYNSWQKNGLNTELHMYSKGGHGFGIYENELPSSKWIERFYEWAVSEGFIGHKK